MGTNHTLVYIMRHIDIGQYIEIPYKKVGITGSGNATLTTRLQQISDTKSPIKAQYVAAWEHSNAFEIEKAIHQLLDDSRVEGEWFLDKNDNLVDRMRPLMKLLGATEIEIKKSEDAFTKNIENKETQVKENSQHILLDEIQDMLGFDEPLRSSIRIAGPTLFSDNKELTYYIDSRKNGNHKFHIGRSKKIKNELSSFLKDKIEQEIEYHDDGDLIISPVSSLEIAEIIKMIETSF